MSARRHLSRGTRRAPASRKKHHCPVLALAHEYEQLAVKHLALDKSDDKSGSMELIHERLASIQDQASYLIARSATGALFQIMLLRDQHVCSHLEANAAPRESGLQRIERLAYAIKAYLQSAGAKALPKVEDYCMSDATDPHRRLAKLRA